MEQATNTFSKGLQMDLHPMTQGNDSLTDALNATFITMNSNEVILQNDMGNRRIDHAFLPSGYEPVGIKEHGGIIYVASYNPITNKSQIGSFPSPERIIDINDDNLKNNFDFDSFFKEKTSEGGNIQNDSTLNIPVMISDSFLISLTPKNKLHVGDIFTVYSPHLSKLAPDLTNYDNIEHSKDKVYSPKNRKYTLQLGILNEQNNFNDITSSLVRWDSPLKEVTEKEYNEYKTTKEIRYYIYENNVQKEVTEEYYNSFIGTKQLKYFIYVPQIIRNLENKSQLYKFNTGYFIPDGFLSDKDIDGKTIDDANLIKSRKQIAANNFSYKLAGPLYLKASYNHVHSFGYTINGTWDGTTATLKITGYFTYNCPDGVNTINDNGDSDYYTFETGEPTNIQFDFFDNNENTLNKPAKIEPSATSTSTCIYNKTTNLYTVTQVKEYTIENPGDIYNYVIGVQGGKYNGNNIFYIKDLSSIGQINLRLLNSGAITLKQYKFYNKVETHDTTMTLEFETYPKEGQTFEDMYLEFENILNVGEPKRYLALHQPILNGKQVFSFNWLDSISNDAEGTEYDENFHYEQANIKLKAKQTYKVTIHYKDNDTQLIQEINTDLDQKREQLSQKTDPTIIEQLKAQINSLQNQLDRLDSSIYDDEINRWLLTTELFNDLYSSNLTDYCNKTLTDGNQLFQDKLTITPDVNLDLLYRVQYSNVVFTPLYIVDDTKDTNLTIKQTVSFISKADSGISLDVSDYPEYIGTPQLIIQGNDSSVELQEIIEKDSYEPLIVYHPIRTIADYKDKILASFIGYAYSQDKSGEDYTKMIYFYKRSYEEYTLNQGGGKHPTTLNEGHLQSIGWNKGWEDKKNDGSIYKNITNLQDLADVSNIFSLYKGFYFPATFGINHGGDDVSEGDSFYIGGPFYAVNRNTSNSEDIAFVKRDPAESNLLINWNELQASEPVYKINGDEPTIKQFTRNLTYTVQITGASNNIPEYSNLIFKIDTEEQEKEQTVKYDNSQIVYEYKLYKNKTQDSYINMNTGYKITNTSYDQVDSNGVFKVENYSVLKYLKPTKFDKLARCRDDDESYVAEIRGYYSTNISNAKEFNFVNTYPLTTYDPITETDVPIEHPNKIGYTFSTNIQYKIDNGSWIDLLAGEEVTVGYNDPRTPGGVKEKQIIYWRKSVDIGNYNNNGVGTFTSKEYVYNAESAAEAEEDKYEYSGNAGKFVAYDNILSIIYGENFEDKTAYINYAFKDLFKNCSGLTNASGISLQADLAIGCFQSMFENCTSMTESPVLSASKFKNNCYSRMFNGCTNLSKVTCLASDPLNIFYVNATTDWLENVANSGEFIQKSGYSLWGTGNSGIPNGWTKTEV